MLVIVKNSEPKGLIKHRKTSHSTYDNISSDTKHEIRCSLLIEQGELCAYCMQRISEDNMKIEHYLPQSQGTNQTDLQYGNMLGVCLGGEGKPKTLQTCDTCRGNKPLNVNPLDATSISKIDYTTSGLITSDDDSIYTDLDKTLNLNVSSLIDNRKSALDALKKELLAKSKKHNSDWKSLAQKYMKLFQSSGRKREYCGILLWYLRKKT